MTAAVRSTTVTVISHRSYSHAHIRRESRFLPTTPALGAAIEGPRRNTTITLVFERLERCGYPSVENCLF